MTKGSKLLRRMNLLYVKKCLRALSATCTFLIITVSPYRTLFGQEAAVQNGGKLQGLLSAIAENEALLTKYPDSDFTPNLMFQIAELYVRKARYEFQQEMLIYEESEKKYDQGLLKKEPIIPRIDFADALRMCDNLLKKYPNVAFRDKVMYRIAVCHLEEGNKEKSVEYLQNLSYETTEKQYLEESYFRLGEYYFEQKDYEQAIDYYRRLLNSWDSAYFDMALYKLGWSYYNLDDFAQAISTLIYLVDDINLVEEVDNEYLGRTNADLRKEAIEFVAVCFADYSGPEKARIFLKDRTDKDYTEKILLRLAAVYQKRNYYEDANETLNILLELYPTKPDAPRFQRIIVDYYELAGERERANEARIRFMTKYGPGTPWFENIKDDSLRQSTMEVAEEFLYTLGTEAQANAQQSKSKLQYGLAVNRYESYLEKFPTSERSGKVRFYLSECLFEIGRYQEAADSYHKVVLDYPESEFRETAGYNRVLTYNSLLKNDRNQGSTVLYLRNFLGKHDARVDTIATASVTQGQLMQASNDFIIHFSSSSKLPEVLMNYAQILYELGEFGLAKEAYKLVVTHPSQHDFLPQAYSMIAQCSFKQNDYEESEDWFLKLSQQFPDSSRYVEKANKMIASSRFKLAETYVETGDIKRAVHEFERVANAVSDQDVAERALFEAALLYENMGDKYKAVGVYESLSRRFPNSTSVDKSLFKAGVLSEQLEDWERAATNYLAVYKFDPASQFASKSLFSAARCYESYEDYDKARTSYDEYLRTYREDPDRFLEAAFKKGEIAFNQRNYSLALRDFEFVISAFQAFVSQERDVEKYIPANAQFLIGEILFDSFRNIQLRQPLERSLKRKRSKFEQVIKAYTDAAKYKVADWTTASSYKIGLTFESFANTLLDSPRPARLNRSELVNYNQKLWESVLPFKKKALNTYQANVRQAMQNSLNNQWVTESKKRMEALAVELGIETIKLGHESGS